MAIANRGERLKAEKERLKKVVNLAAGHHANKMVSTNPIIN